MSRHSDEELLVTALRVLGNAATAFRLATEMVRLAKHIKKRRQLWGELADASPDWPVSGGSAAPLPNEPGGSGTPPTGTEGGVKRETP